MTEGIHEFHERRHGHLTRWPVAAALALLLAACGGDGSGTDVGTTPTPPAVVQKGFGPAQLYNPSTNPNGHVLQEGDTGIVFLPQASIAAATEQQVWFEIADASTYAFEMQDEDLTILAKMEVNDATGQPHVTVDADHRFASAMLAPGRYALRLVASPASRETPPLFIRFSGEATQASQAGAFRKLAQRAGDRHLFPGISPRTCVGCDLSGAYLKNMDLRQADLSGATLRAANLEGANLSDANLSGANLERANLALALLKGASLERVSLERADLSWVNLSETSLKGAKFRDAFLGGANLERVSLQGEDLTGAMLEKANLSEADLSGANLSEAILWNANLKGANLRGANLSGASLYGANLRGAIWVDGRTCGESTSLPLGKCQ
ncbi:pentapeptide repeat-containing protein [Ralstonia sp. UBA689]|uniref:pentapeptide repeat-containing protein n=1 Tax=Ralstonia sp. UBA689 TaxID=1947373 RepID=UPI0025CCC9A0|nr:pentapeptide repeat-containing protein [Ralstonia sp. UBA689]